jgi:SAM-dependent methyltransferase
MKMDLKPHCPACTNVQTVRLGKLPDSNLFAGTFIDRVLDGGSLYRCKKCTLKFRYPIDDAAIYDSLYDNRNTLTWPANAQRPDWELIVQYLSEHQASGRILDFGCYTGGLLERLGDTYDRYGVEINHAAAAAASRITGRPTFASIDEISGQLRFDAILVCDVVEHMVNPGDILERLGMLLSENGILILTTGDSENPLWNRFGANWWYCYYPEHISFISETWLQRNSEELGLAMEHCETFRYTSLKPTARPIHIALTYFYGWFPNIYLILRKVIDSLRGKPGTSSVTGVGVSDDHLIAVLRSNRKQ